MDFKTNVEVKARLRFRRNNQTNIQIPSAFAHSEYQALSPPIKGPGDEAIVRHVSQVLACAHLRVN